MERELVVGKWRGNDYNLSVSGGWAIDVISFKEAQKKGRNVKSWFHEITGLDISGGMKLQQLQAN